MIFPVERYQNIQGWIPESDIDGIDAKKDFLADIHNADLENGFIQGCIAPTGMFLPTLVSTAISDNYELLEAKNFYHSTRGNIFFYILWKEQSNPFKFIVQEIDNSIVTELTLSDTIQYDNVLAPTIKPTIVSYNLVEDEFKINLNVEAYVVNYLNNSGKVILNLSLQYLDEVTYKTGDAFRPEGWYLTPRWLGWGNNICFVSGGGNDLDYLSTDFEGTLPTWFTLNSGEHFDTGGRPGKILKLEAGESSYIDDLYVIGKIKVRAFTDASIATLRFRLYDTVDAKDIWIGEIQLKGDGDGSVRTSEESYLRNTDGGRGVGSNRTLTSPRELSYVLEVNTAGKTCRLYIENETSETGDILIHSLEVLSSEEDFVVVAKYFDGQRAIVENLATFSKLLYTPDTPLLRIQLEEVDWRIAEYEIYTKFGEFGLYYLIANILTDDDSWTKTETSPGQNKLEHEIAFTVTSTTLNFNYGLGASVSVNVQNLIYDEVFYRNRVYFVKETNKVHLSHISGTGRPQPDSFPYNEDIQFGFFITASDEINLALAITNLQELFIIGRNTNYCFYIEAGSGTVYKNLRANNGGQSIVSRKSLVKKLSGEPESVVLLWCDEQGVYIYGGGKNHPEDITIPTHRNYWKNIQSKENLFAFYNKAKTEFWIVVGDIILIYELKFNKFKKYKYEFTIKSYIGRIGNVLYFLTAENEVKKWDMTSITRLEAIIETHYNANTIIVGQYPIEAPEHITKILQQIYVAVKDKITNLLGYTIIADGNTYDEIKMPTQFFTDVTPSPLLIRYGKIKLRIRIPAGVNLREFGYHFSIPNEAPAQQVTQPIQGIGMDSGLNAGVGL